MKLTNRGFYLNTYYIAFLCAVNGGCQPETFTKEQQLLAEAGRYGCYALAGQKATEALTAACPDFVRSSTEPFTCPAVDLVIDVLNKDLEACDAE